MFCCISLKCGFISHFSLISINHLINSKIKNDRYFLFTFYLSFRSVIHHYPLEAYFCGARRNIMSEVIYIAVIVSCLSINSSVFQNK